MYIKIIILILHLECLPIIPTESYRPRVTQKLTQKTENQREIELEKINSRMLTRRERQTPNYVSQSVKDFEYSKRKRRPRSKLTKNPRKTTSLTKLRKS